MMLGICLQITYKKMARLKHEHRGVKRPIFEHSRYIMLKYEPYWRKTIELVVNAFCLQKTNKSFSQQ